MTLETAGYYLTGLQGCGCRKSKPVPMEVTPLPEPRDIDWGELETLDQEHGEKSDRMNAGRLIKLCVWFGYSAIVAVFAVNWEALCKEYAKDDDSRTPRCWELLAGFVPAYFQDWLFDYVAVILYNTNRMFNSLWSESSLQASVARDYSIFFWIVAFGAYLLSVTWADISNEAWSCEGECDAEDEDEDADVDAASFNPSVAVRLMARAVPRHAWPFAAIFLMQIGDMAADCAFAAWIVPSMARGARNLISARVVPYIKYGPRSRRTRAWRNRSSRRTLTSRAGRLGGVRAAGGRDFRLHLAVHVRRLLPLLRGRVRGHDPVWNIELSGSSAPEYGRFPRRPASMRSAASRPCPSTRAARSGSTASRRPTPRCLSRWSSSLSYCGLTSPIKGSGRSSAASPSCSCGSATGTGVAAGTLRGTSTAWRGAGCR